MVEKVFVPEELAAYLSECAAFADRLRGDGTDPSGERLLIQAMAPGRLEFGVLYARHPGDDDGEITSIVEKELLTVFGDGERTLAALIDAGERTRLHRTQLFADFTERLTEVPSAGTEVPLVEVGNHIRGATFLDANAHATPDLAVIFHELALALEGFYIGRFDLRCDSVEALAAGRFQVIEVNGVNSEPAHIYDPSNRLAHAYRDLLRHWRRVESIAAANARNGCPIVPAGELFGAIRRHARRRSLAG